MPTKQEIYKAEIEPLIKQAVQLCEKNKICHLMLFDLDVVKDVCSISVFGILRREFDPSVMFAGVYKMALDVFEEAQRAQDVISKLGEIPEVPQTQPNPELN